MTDPDGDVTDYTYDAVGNMVKQTDAFNNEGFYFQTEKANGIKYLYAWLDRHPNVRQMVGGKPMRQ